MITNHSMLCDVLIYVDAMMLIYVDAMMLIYVDAMIFCNNFAR